MTKKSISVVIPNFNGRNLLKENLPSLITALKKINVDYEIIVSDDASTDNSVSFLKENYPNIVLIENKINKGFSPNINTGIMAAKMDLIFALNSDVKLSEEYFLPLINYFSDENIFGVSGKIINENNGTLLGCATLGKMKGFQITYYDDFYVETKSDNELIPSFYLSGANALMDRKKLQLLKGYNEIYAPFYVEDVDLSLRAWQLGWASYYEHNATCYHADSVTIKKSNKANYIKTTAIRNKLILQELHLHGVDNFLWKIQLYANLFFKTLTFKHLYLNAFKEYKRKSKEIAASKTEFNTLKNNYQNQLSIPELIKKINSDLLKYSIKKL